MKKVIVPLKEENCVIRELNDEEIKKIEVGGCFTCFTFKRCVSLSWFDPCRSKAVLV